MNDSAVHLAWYTNVLSSFAIIPIIVLTGEVPAVLEMFLDPSQLRTFFYGSLVTVSIFSPSMKRRQSQSRLTCCFFRGCSVS